MAKAKAKVKPKAKVNKGGGAAVAKTKRRRSKRSMTLPVSMVIGGFPLVNQMVLGYKSGGFTGAGKEATFALTGYHIDTGTRNNAYLWNGLWPLMLGGVIHWGANRIGINRFLAQSRIPLIRV